MHPCRTDSYKCDNEWMHSNTHFMLGSVPVSAMLSLKSSSAKWLRVLIARGCTCRQV